MRGRRQRRKFSRQFKADVVTQMLRGTSVAQLSQGNDIKPGVQYRWLRRGGTGAGNGYGRDAAQQGKIRKLEREVGYLKEQQAVFRKAFSGADRRR